MTHPREHSHARDLLPARLRAQLPDVSGPETASLTGAAMGERHFTNRRGGRERYRRLIGTDHHIPALSHIFDPAGVRPRLLRSTRLAEPATSINPKLVSAAFGIRPEGVNPAGGASSASSVRGACSMPGRTPQLALADQAEAEVVRDLACLRRDSAMRRTSSWVATGPHRQAARHVCTA
jgi:hypothetical protein